MRLSIGLPFCGSDEHMGTLSPSLLPVSPALTSHQVRLHILGHGELLIRLVLVCSAPCMPLLILYDYSLYSLCPSLSQSL